MLPSDESDSDSIHPIAKGRGHRTLVSSSDESDSDSIYPIAKGRGHRTLVSSSDESDSDKTRMKDKGKGKGKLGYKKLVISSDESGRDDGSDSTCDDSLRVQKDDIVALVESDSSVEEPKILLGRVQRIHKKAVLLAWLEPMAKGKYRFSIGGKTWWEDTSSLVYPVDIVYCQKTNMYTLRTPLIDIHNYIFN